MEFVSATKTPSVTPSLASACANRDGEESDVVAEVNVFCVSLCGGLGPISHCREFS